MKAALFARCRAWSGMRIWQKLAEIGELKLFVQTADAFDRIMISGRQDGVPTLTTQFRRL